MQNGHHGRIANDSLNVRLIGQYPTGISTSVELDVERNLVFVGTSDKIVILDVSNPTDPVFLSELLIDGLFVDDLDYIGNYLYVVDHGGYPSFKVFSVVDPQNPEIVGGFHVDMSATCIAVEDTIAYAGFDVTGGAGGLEILSIADLTNVRPISDIWLSTAREVLVDDTLVYVTTELEGLQIVSVSDPSDPLEVGHYNTIAVAEAVALVDTIAYVAARDIHVISVADPSSPMEISSYSTPGNPIGIVCTDSFAYLADGDQGFRILSITDPTSLSEVGYYHTVGFAEAVAFSEPYAYVATWEEGLLIFEYYDPTSIGDKEDEDIVLPKTFSLSQNYPNPFNPSTMIDYSIPEGESILVRLIVYDIRGRLIRTLVCEEKNPGFYSVRWDGKDGTGREVGSGVYVYKMIAGSSSLAKKMVILR